jgi:hypothetical protein
MLLYNWIGYSFLYDYLTYRTDKQLEKQFDRNDYNESDLVAIKLPIRLPYQASQTEFERFDGEVNLNGIHYKYVKRRVYNDSLILLCLPNDNKSRLQEAKKEFFRTVNDLQHSSPAKKEKGNNFFKSLEYSPEQNSWQLDLAIAGWKNHGGTKISMYASYQKDRPERPPQYNIA